MDEAVHGVAGLRGAEEHLVPGQQEYDVVVVEWETELREAVPSFEHSIFFPGGSTVQGESVGRALSYGGHVR